MESQQRSKRMRAMPMDFEGDEKRGRLFQAEGRGSLQAVVNNHLVCEIIASFLSLNDIKAVSEVNPQFRQAMCGTKRFAQKAVLAITDKNAEKPTLEKMEYSWRGVRIDVRDSSDILDDLPRVLKSAQFVCLGAPPGKIKNVTKAEDPTAARLLTTVLNSTPALSHLQIGIHFLLPDLDLRPVLSSPAVQETLRNLNRLDILKKTEYEGQNYIAWFLKNKEADEENNPFERNFRLLTELPNRLKTFDLPKKFPATWMKDSANNQSVLRLLRNNATSMEELSVHGRVWKLQELGRLTLPVLKTLSATVHKEEEKETLAKFLENQRLLEELTMEWTVQCPVPLIRARCMELRKLDLTTDLYSGDVEDWRFLGSMNRLKEFRFKILEFPGVPNGWRLLAFLPKNQLERLSLEGISTIWSGFWSVDRGVNLEFGVKTRLLQGFRCLRKLSFLGSREAVDDKLMQWLLKEFVSLEELELSDCYDLSSAGISGDTSAEWGCDASLSDLRGLKSLKILNCPGVTPKAVASCVKLPFLKSLDYSSPNKVPVSVVLALAGQNPRLERLGLNFWGDLANVKAKVCKVNPRVELVMTLPHG